jgi:hypothetical protein
MDGIYYMVTVIKEHFFSFTDIKILKSPKNSFK